MGASAWLLDNILWVSIGSLVLLAAAHFGVVYLFKASGKKPQGTSHEDQQHH